MSRVARRALVGLAAGAALLVGAGAGAAPAGTVGARSPISRPSADDWPTYGHDAQHTFHGRTTLTETTAARLGTAWFFPTGDAVTATPTVVDGVVYVGSWDDTFYAVRLATGQLLWKYALSRQDAVTPYPGEPSRDATSDGGLVTSSAWYQPGNGTRPDLVIFGGGYTLYALNAHTGALYWRHDYTGQPALPPRPEVDGARIFSSPVVSGTKVLFAVDVDGQRGERGYVVAASLDSGSPVWTYETDTDTAGHLLNNGCGNVWSSGSLLPRAGLVVFDEGDCHFSNPPPTSETVFALHVDTGRLAWRFQPHRADNACDFDFGASANVGVNPGGAATFVGVGGKDGTYYSLDPATGHLRWKTNVVFGGFSGGFTGTAAYDGTRVVASTGIGDFGRFESNGNHLCDPSDPADTQMQEPTVHALSANHGAVLWQATGVASFAPTTVAGAMTFNGLALSDAVQVRDAATGRVLVSVSLPAPCWSGIATVGNAVVFGTGASETGEPDGIYALTPGGAGPGR